VPPWDSPATPGLAGRPRGRRRHHNLAIITPRGVLSRRTGYLVALFSLIRSNLSSLGPGERSCRCLAVRFSRLCPFRLLYLIWQACRQRRARPDEHVRKVSDVLCISSQPFYLFVLAQPIVTSRCIAALPASPKPPLCSTGLGLVQGVHAPHICSSACI
jgi:hypothetical protein